MDNNENRGSRLYQDIKNRTNGEIYIGVVGPVRTGKSTFIKRFMEELVLNHITDEHEKNRAIDELPQSSGGKTITTTEPKFIPKEAIEITLDEEADVQVSVRLVDCVGYMVEGASGHIEDAKERMVKTPWFDYAIPFTKAAEIGTKRVINEHSTIGIVITSDGSFGEIPRENYLEAEGRAIMELKSLNRPFIVLLNSNRPYSADTQKTADEIALQYQVTTMCVNCEQLKREDLNRIIETILYEFPLSAIEFYMPKWIELLPNEHIVKKELVNGVRELMTKKQTIHDIKQGGISLSKECCKRLRVDHIDMSTGVVRVLLELDEQYYYQMFSDMLGEEIKGEYQMLSLFRTLVQMKKEYEKVKYALDAVRYKGYGVVTPEREEITLEEPQVIKHGNKFGVKIKAESPSIHMIRANIETEIAPIVGSEDQANDLIEFINQARKTQEGIWETNIFGKSIAQLVNDGISNKVAMIGDESQMKLQETMQKIVNDTNGGLVCIII
ncbi:MAG: stage IV sporulation protein A [Clostridia bacterium]|nr:stage IV sporulation protein A [Clostridia bacterium]